ncbi:phosphonate ABC transporter ATP-binding protein [Pelagibacteraceae bacterium]|jgi:phosphonate transport system ATP-binding protein|nr:phosphonate ABC transporter ATP-binding protein [Pelagibacteraceae bacterium]
MLKILNLQKTFADGTEAVKYADFQVTKGEFVVILGPSGSGKTTLLRCINGLAETTKGKIFLDDQEISFQNPSVARNHISMVFQDFNLVQNISVINNVLSGMLDKCHPLASLLYLFNKDQKLRALECLDQVGLLSKSYSRTSRLSGGQQQRVGIARALSREPLMILADEPVASLDPKIAFEVLSLLKDISASQGITVICNLHQLDLALHFSDRIIGLKDGEIIVNEITKNLDPEYIHNIYGSSHDEIFFGSQKNTNQIFL